MSNKQQPPLPTLQPGDSHMESLIQAAIQGHASTRDAMRWLVRQLVPATQARAQVQVRVPMTDDERGKAYLKHSKSYEGPRSTFMRGVWAAEAHHRITAQAKKEGA